MIIFDESYESYGPLSLLVFILIIVITRISFRYHRLHSHDDHYPVFCHQKS